MNLFDKENAQDWLRTKKWFRYHKATVTRHEGVEILKWSQPGTGVYGMYFTLSYGMLSVTGDLGEAIIENRGGCVEGWGFLDDFNSYFMEKLRATSEGHKYHKETLLNFNQEMAIEDFKDTLAEQLKESEFPKEKIKGINEFVDDLFWMGFKAHDAHHFTQQIYDSITSLKPHSETVYHLMLEEGPSWQNGTIKIRIKAIWLALQLACRQLNHDYNKPIRVLEYAKKQI